jgi:two-component system KDP operon response regulator KdpE
VLVVDDEPAILRAVQTNLGRHDFQVETASSGHDALEALARVHPDLILLDLGLPDMDGLDVIRTIRQRMSTPIVVLSARDAERDKVAALDLGADDYLTKPFGVNELLARVRVALRHAAGPATGTEPVIRLGELEVNLERRRLVAYGVEVHLTPTEWDLIKLFSSQPDRVLTDRMIMHAVWGSAYQAQAHSLHVYVGRLRKKLEAAPGAKRHLLTEPGVGYRFVTEGLLRSL